MADKGEIENTILEYVRREYLGENEELNPETPLISSGIVDSFSMVSLKLFAESRYKIAIPDEQATPEAFNSVARIAELIVRSTK